nr:MAG TPA: hypothetical protein [Caudoviricetes sp.]
MLFVHKLSTLSRFTLRIESFIYLCLQKNESRGKTGSR